MTTVKKSLKAQNQAQSGFGLSSVLLTQSSCSNYVSSMSLKWPILLLASPGSFIQIYQMVKHSSFFTSWVAWRMSRLLILANSKSGVWRAQSWISVLRFVWICGNPYYCFKCKASFLMYKKSVRVRRAKMRSRRFIYSWLLDRSQTTLTSPLSSFHSMALKHIVLSGDFAVHLFSLAFRVP